MRIRAAFGCLIALLLTQPANAQGSWIEVIAQFGAAGEMIGNIADGLKKAVDAGYQIVDTVQAHELKAKVLDVESSIAMVIVGNGEVIQRLSLYLRRKRSDEEEWHRIRQKLAETKTRVAEVGNTVLEAGPKLVEVAGPTLVKDLVLNFSTRGIFVAQLINLPEPFSTGHVDDLKKLVKEYQTLVDETTRLNEELDSYTKKFGG